MSQLQQALDEQKSKSLDQREHDLEEREKLLNDSERLLHIEELDGQIAILDSQIEIKEASKSLLDKDIEKLQKQVITEESATDEKIAQLRKSIAKEQDAYNLLITKREKLNGDIALSTKKLQALKNDAREQEEYLKEQEQNVNNAIAEWNAQLNDLHAEAENVIGQKKANSVQLSLQTQQIQENEDILEQFNQKSMQLNNAYNNKKHQYAQELQQIKQDIIEKQAELANINIKLQKRLDDIEIREQSLAVKEAAAIYKHRDLSEREQRLNMRLDMV